MRKVIVAVVLTVVLVLAVPIYFRWGWSRMVSECDFSHDAFALRHTGVTSESVSYSWHWSDGFTCKYSNGKTRTSYWF